MAPLDSAVNGSTLDEDDIRLALTFWLGEAHREGVTVDGNWSIETVESLPDWELEIFEVSQ